MQQWISPIRQNIFRESVVAVSDNLKSFKRDLSKWCIFLLLSWLCNLCSFRTENTHKYNDVFIYNEHNHFARAEIISQFIILCELLLLSKQHKSKKCPSYKAKWKTVSKMFRTKYAHMCSRPCVHFLVCRLHRVNKSRCAFMGTNDRRSF